MAIRKTLMLAQCESDRLEPSGKQDRSREDIFRELELILDAKKNINSIVVAMYSVFYSLEGFLLYGFYALGSVAARVSIAFFGAICLLGLVLVTLRTKGTNNR